tara:strand:+ start:956 stop:1444 length:489 start_codon:yes stop_codon:yes gene_type:complete
MKKIFFVLIFIFTNSLLLAAGSDSSDSGPSKVSLYEDAVKLVKRASKLEQKEKNDKAKKLYSRAFKTLNKAYKADKNNPDILNYMGFTSRKIGNFEVAEKYYLEGLKINPNHNGINEYLGELYVQTNRIEKAKERLDVLKNCNCEEFKDLDLIIKTKGVKFY